MSETLQRNGWLTVDLDGLANTLKRRGKNFILSELLRNSLDEAGVTEVHITLRKADFPGQYVLSVADNSPDGFRNLTESYTMFAPSYKKANPEQAGRFNAGEKFVLALCETANIVSTTGSVVFTRERGRQNSTHKQEKGTTFSGWIEMTDDEAAEMISYAEQLIIPGGVLVTLNKRPLAVRSPVKSFEAALPSEINGPDGVLRRFTRNTVVQVFRPLAGETPSLYELGIPVMELEGKYHVNVLQKVPLNIERDAVPPSYIRKVNTLLVNELYTELGTNEAADQWVKDGTESKNISTEALEHVMTLRFGEKRVAYDPSDREANRTAASQGYNVVHGGSLSKDEWANVKSIGAIEPAGKVVPTYNPYPGGEEAEFVPEEDWTPGMKDIRDFIHAISIKLLGKIVMVRYEKGRRSDPFNANYGDQTLIFNLDKLGRSYFDRGRTDLDLLRLILHELAHESGGHLTKEFDDALANLGARLTSLALSEPELFLLDEGGD